MQRRTRQMRDGRLQSIKTIVQRQQCMPSECDDGRLLGFGQDRRAWFLRPGLQVLNGLAFAPLRYGLGFYTKLSAQLRERSLRSLYCNSDGVRGRGAPMTNLSHNASFHS